MKTRIEGTAAEADAIGAGVKAAAMAEATTDEQKLSLEMGFALQEAAWAVLDKYTGRIDNYERLHAVACGAAACATQVIAQPHPRPPPRKVLVDVACGMFRRCLEKHLADMDAGEVTIVWIKP